MSKANKSSQLSKAKNSPVLVPVTSLKAFESKLDPEYWDLLQNIAVASLALAVNLMQIRSFNLGSPIAELDQLSSVKFYKGLLARNSKPLAAALVIIDTAAFVPPNASNKEVLDEIENYADRMTGNSQALERVTEQNLVQYRFGLASRILGQLQSCPMTNPDLLGFDQRKVQDLSLEDICKCVGFGDPAKAKTQILDVVGNQSTVFNEPSLATGPTLGGYTKLEKEIFGDNIVRTQPINAKTSVGFGGMVQLNSINKSAITDVLDPWELQVYKSASDSGNIKVLKDMNELIKSRIDSNSKINTTSVISGTNSSKLGSSPAQLGIAAIAKKLILQKN